jgi:hypothetical protein
MLHSFRLELENCATTCNSINKKLSVRTFPGTIIYIIRLLNKILVFVYSFGSIKIVMITIAKQ